jgi:transcriptional regulator with XRE-family HTH domain
VNNDKLDLPQRKEGNSVNVQNRLIALRGNRSQREVAEAVGIAPSTLSMYENGERVPSDQIKIKLASLYGKSVGYIFFDEDDTLSD